MTKTAVVLFNLGGPDQLSAVEPFLFNLFNDKAIIDLPNPFRWILAKYISWRRGPIARGIYQNIGGKSPILQMTQKQADELEKVLNAENRENHTKVFIAMRYWHPMSDQTVGKVLDFGPDNIILLPLYPQFSTTTTGSSIKDWNRAAAQAGLTAPAQVIKCYQTDPGWVSAYSDLTLKCYKQAVEKAVPRILFSAHGLPKKIIEAGDPYQSQIEQGAREIIKQILEKLELENLDWNICYQSRVGRLEWIGPSLDEELKRAAGDKVSVVIVPISFVSEHSETLVELDIEYAEMAEELGIPGYFRVPTVGTDRTFIKGLANLVEDAANGSEPKN